MGYACDEIIEVDDISEDIVTVLAPINAVVLEDTSVKFSWNAVEYAENYRIQIAEPDFETAQQIVVDSTQSATNFTTTLDGTAYEWRVRAENSGYVTAYTSQRFSINALVPDISNEIVTVLAPADASTFTTTDTISFSWNSLTDAENYVIQIAIPDFANATEIIEDVTQTETTFSVSNLDESSYEWRVKATNADSETAYTTQTFTVE